jgi:RIO kinase 1
VIDVSQSVEHDHPRSLDFLRMDIKNITDYFRKKGVITLHERKAFEFITAEGTTVDYAEMAIVVEKMKEEQGMEIDEEVDARVFRQAYIPKSLFEVVDPERDVGIVQEGGKDDLIYGKFLKVLDTKPVKTMDVVQNKEDVVDTENTIDEQDDTDADISDTSSDEASQPRGKRHEDKDAKRVHHLII